VFAWFYLRSKGSLLVAMFLHTSMNTLSDLGFSKFEYSLIFLFLLMMGAALLFALSSKEFQSATDCAGTHP
jgi:membrane protease YdiL (CAAX protease family)